jgi:2-C-methyl-D-erythritol 2,4-cyclodiphosphate synthase
MEKPNPTIDSLPDTVKPIHESLRIGYGYDVHRLVENRKLILGGVEVPCEKGLDGHSDADVLLHAISDALLGAAALGDIGKHFPDTDQRYKGISSLLLLKHVGDLLTHHRYEIVNIDATVVLERPKIAPYIDQMRQNIADVLALPIQKISIKATTSERLGFVGTGEGAVAHAITLLIQQ